MGQCTTSTAESAPEVIRPNESVTPCEPTPALLDTSLTPSLDTALEEALASSLDVSFPTLESLDLDSTNHDVSLPAIPEETETGTCELLRLVTLIKPTYLCT